MLTVETGEGLANADAYVSLDAFKAWLAANKDTAAADDDVFERAIRRATAWIDAEYQARFPGLRRFQRIQALAWPRSDAVDADGWVIAFAEVPREVIAATCEAAYREMVEPGTLAPDLERGGAVSRIKAGSVEIEYGANAMASTVFQDVRNALGRILRPSSPFSGVAVRC